MAYTKVSIPKKTGGPGTPEAKEPNVIFILVKDLLKVDGAITGFPDRDSNGVLSTSDLALAVGAEAVGVYCTPSTINRFDSSEGDVDKAGFIQNFSGEHPGDELAFAEWLQNNVNEDFLIISKECSSSAGTRLHGTPCNPMKLEVSGQDNNEGKMSTLTFKSIQRSSKKMMHYVGALPTLAADYASGYGGL
ncbi:MAG: hypothetical protein JXR07_20290 [Reichenbachiella sp.]